MSFSSASRSSSSASGKKGKKGQNWKSQVNLVYPSDRKYYAIEDQTLKSEMSELIDETEKILQNWVYKCKLRALWWQITQLFFNHQFFVLGTTKWWWSIEKDDARILIQRSKQLKDVRDSVDTIEDGKHFKKERRNPVCELSYDIGRKSMKDLIDFLYNTDELNIKYDLLNDNCKHFAKRIFDEFAETKFHDTVFGTDFASGKKSDSSPFHAFFISNDDDSLKKVKSEMSDANELILQIWVLKCPLSSWQLTQLFFNHQFVVFETQNWWWSIEKDEARFLIQRSKNVSNVQNYFGTKPRITPVRQLSYDKGQKSVKDLIHFLHDKNERIKNVLREGSCNDFAKIIFDEFAETKFHGIVFGAS